MCIFNVFTIYMFNMHVEFERMYFSLTLSLDAYVFTWYRNPCNPVNLLVGGGAVGVVVVVVVMLVHWYYHQYAVHRAGQLGDTIGKGGTIHVDTHTFRLRGVNAWRLSKHQEERRLENLGEKCPGISWALIGNGSKLNPLIMHDDIMHAPNCGMMWADVCQNGHWKPVTLQTFVRFFQGGKSAKQNSCDSDRTPNRKGSCFCKSKTICRIHGSDLAK